MATAWRAYALGCRPAALFLGAVERCTLCSLCVETCPTHDLSLVPPVGSCGQTRNNGCGAVLVPQACTPCLRCVGVCPEQAMQLSRRTKDMATIWRPGIVRPWATLTK